MAIQSADVMMPGNENAFETGRLGQISSIADLDESYRWMLEKNVTAEPRSCSVEPDEAWGSDAGMLFELGRASSNELN